MDWTIGVLPAVSVMAFGAGAISMWGLWSMLMDEQKLVVRQRLNTEVRQGQESPILKQLAAIMDPIHRVLPLGRYVDWLLGKLDAAGVRMPVWHLLVLQEVAAILGMGFYIAFQRSGNDPVDPLWVAFAFFLGLLLPLGWLHSRIRARRETVARDLPEVVDLLALCVGAGADFMSALTRIVREFRPCPVREELAIVLSEVRVGKRRRDALRAFATRMQTAESSTFARTLIQADRMGTGLIDALTVLSEDMRIARYHWAERFAQRAPLKMLIPLVISLGSAMVIIAGPIIIRFLRGGVMGLADSTIKSQQEGMNSMFRPPSGTPGYASEVRGEGGKTK